MAVRHIEAFDEVYEFLVSTPTPQQILDFRPSQATQERISFLLEKNREGGLSPEENAELDDAEEVEHFVTMLKIKAQMKLNAK